MSMFTHRRTALTTRTTNSTLGPTVMYLVALLICGSNGIVASYINLPSYQIVFFRMLLGALFLGVLLLITHSKPSCLDHVSQIKYLIFSGLALGLQWSLLFEAYRQVGVGVATLEYYCGPIIVMALSPILFHERLTWQKISGLVVVMIGMGLIVGYGVGEKLSLAGLSFGAIAAVLYAAMIISNRYAPDIKGIESTTVQLGIGALFVGLLTLVLHGIELPPDGSSVNWGALVLLGLFNTGVGGGLYFPQLTKIPVQRVAVFGYLEPLSAVIFSAILLGEQLGPLKIAGACCIIGGAIFAEVAGNSFEMADISAETTGNSSKVTDNPSETPSNS